MSTDDRIDDAITTLLRDLAADTTNVSDEQMWAAITAGCAQAGRPGAGRAQPRIGQAAGRAEGGLVMPQQMERLEDRLRSRLTELDAGLSVPPGDIDPSPARSVRSRRARQRTTGVVLVAVLAMAVVGVRWLAVADSGDGSRRLDTADRVETAPLTELEFRQVAPAPVSAMGTVVGTESGFVAMGEGSIWFSENGESWAEEVVDGFEADSDWFSGYAEGNGWRVIWGDDGWTSEEAMAANRGVQRIPPNPSIAWVSRDGGPWVRSVLPGSDFPDSGAHGGFIGPAGPVLVGHRSTVDPEDSNQPVFNDVVAARLAELGIEHASWIVDPQSGRIVVLAHDGSVSFSGTAEELGLPADALSAYEGPSNPTQVWTTTDGESWTVEDEPPIDGAVLGFPNPQATEDGLFAMTATADGTFGLWHSADGSEWQELAAPGRVAHVVSGPGGLFAVGHRDGVPAMWRSGDVGRTWQELALPSLHPDARWQTLVAGPRGVAAVTTTMLGETITPCPTGMSMPSGSDAQSCEFLTPRVESRVLFSPDWRVVVQPDLPASFGDDVIDVGLAMSGDRILVQASKAPDPLSADPPPADTWIGTPAG